MISRNLKPIPNNSFFLFGPRGTGKTFWLRHTFKSAIYIDLLEYRVFKELLADPQRLSEFIPKNCNNWVIIDEIQKIPSLLDEVHRLIEKNNLKFILTGSSPRKLKKTSANLLAGRALRYHFFPLTAIELGGKFDLEKTLQYGLLPTLYDINKEISPRDYLDAYIDIYLREEVYQEGLTRNLDAFSRFLETASFSQGQTLNITEVARECAINRKLAESYFNILDDLLIAYRIPIFTKKSKRKLIKHRKFYYFDVGVYQAIRPKSILDTTENIDGAAIETLVLQELKAFIGNNRYTHKIYYWRTQTGLEVDFVIHNDQSLIAIEVKRKKIISSHDLRGLKAFLSDYPMAKAFLLYNGDKKRYIDNIQLIPIPGALQNISQFFAAGF